MSDDDRLADRPQAIVNIFDVVEDGDAAELLDGPAAVMAAEVDGPILELGCGTGRVAIPVARKGSTVIGIDRSASMLARGHMKVQRSRLAARKDIWRQTISTRFSRRTAPS